MTTTTAPEFADLIRTAMRHQDYSVRGLADRLGITHPAVLLWLDGKLPKPDRLDDLAEALDLDPDAVWDAYRATKARQREAATIPATIRGSSTGRAVDWLLNVHRPVSRLKIAL